MKSDYIKIYRLLFFILHFVFTNPAVDIIVFSYNRPLQLDAFLRSLYQNATDIGSVVIIYRADSPFDQAYEKLIKKFYPCAFMRQSTSNPRGDFKNLVVTAMNSLSSSHLAFAVDDLIVKDKIDLSYCVEMLEHTQSYGFYLRLGKNIVESYMEKRHTGTPSFTIIRSDILTWKFMFGQGDWRYPNSVDMTIYRKKDIKNILIKLPYNSPNTLEGIWAAQANLTQQGVCFGFSKVVNLPINMVQQDFSNPHMNHATAQQLLDVFNKGFVLNLEPLYKINNSAPHMNYIPNYQSIRFIKSSPLIFHKNKLVADR